MSSSKQQQQKEVRDNLAQLSKAYRGFFTSPNGKLVLKDLKRRFYDIDLSADSEHKSSVKVGRHNVVLHIERLMNAGEKK